MKAFSVLLRSLALLAVLLIAAPQAGFAGEAEDKALADAVSDRLLSEQADFDATRVIVTAKDGEVKLRGPVRRTRDIKAMIDFTQAIPGVTSVDAELNAMDQGS